MAGETPTGVTNIERVEVPPAEGGETILPEGTDPESPQGNEGEPEGDETVDPENDPADASPDGQPEGLRTPTPPGASAPAGGAPAVVAPAAPAPSQPQGLKRLANESPREFALRLELDKTRKQVRQQRTDEVMGLIHPAAPVAPAAPAIDERAQQILAKYPKEQLDALREVMPALAAEMGFVRKDDLAGSTYTDKAQDSLNSFIEKHPEYLPQNDPEGTLWNAFKTEFGQYKQPNDPKEFARLYEKVHQSVFGIQPGGALPKVNAAQRKIQVASHAGASGPVAPSRQPRQSSGARSSLRLDMLKGFDDESKERIANRAGE